MLKTIGIPVYSRLSRTKLGYVRGSFFFIAAALCIPALALLAPVRITLSARLTVFGGSGEARIAWLCFAVRVPLRARLLRGKPMYVDVLRRDGTLAKRLVLTKKKKQPSKWGAAFRRAIAIESVDAAFIAGVADAPAETALLCGALKAAATEAARMLLPGAESNIRALPVFSYNALLLNIGGIARVGLGKLIQCRLQRRGE